MNTIFSRFQSMKLQWKILLGFGVSFVLMGIVQAWAIFHLYSLRDAANSILRENYQSILAGFHMNRALEKQAQACLLLQLGENTPASRIFHEQETVFLPWLGRATSNITVPGEKNVLADITARYQDFLESFSQAIQGRNPAAEEMKSRVKQLLGEAQAMGGLTDDLHALNQETMFQASERARLLADRAVYSTSLIGIAGLVLGFLFSWFLAAWIVRPLNRMMVAARRLGEGRYQTRVPATAGDELGKLAREFNVMASKLQGYHSLNVGKMMAEKQKNEAILASIDDGIMVVNADFLVTDLNHASCGLLNLPERPKLPLHLLELVPEETLMKAVKEAMETGFPVTMDEEKSILVRKVQGREKFVSFSVSFIRGKESEFPGVMILLRDFTRIREIDQMKTDFVMSASHELCTPLTSIGMSIDLLYEKLRNKLEPREAELLEMAQTEILRLKKQVKDLLDLSKLESGRIDMEMEEVPVQVVFDRALEIFSLQAQEKDVQLIAQTLPDVAIKADPNKVLWVVTNLISNSLRYVSPKGSVSLSASVFDKVVQISVCDDGPGIPLEYQGRIFQKFVQVQGDTTPGGAGLGLAICREIIRAHGGTIWVESEPGKGSRFAFTLPRAGEIGREE